MSLRALPAAAVLSRADVRSACPPSAVKAWNPGVRAASEDPATISILDVIGEDWWTGGGVTAKRIEGALRSVGSKDVTVSINSPGGDYFEGLAIYNLLREHQGKVTVKGPDELQIARAGFLMIHNTWIMAAGDRHALHAAADWLEPFDAAAVDIYAARTGLDAKAIAKMLDAETWIGGQAAVDQGFADELLASDATVDDPKQRARAAALKAERQMDNLGRLAGASRSDVRELLAALKTFKPGAEDDDGKPGAAEGHEALLSLLKSL